MSTATAATTATAKWRESISRTAWRTLNQIYPTERIDRHTHTHTLICIYTVANSPQRIFVREAKAAKRRYV